MARETALWSWLREIRHKTEGAFVDIERIENLLGAGTPDVEGYAHLSDKARGHFWLELKSHERPARPMTPIRFPLQGREKQIAFMRRRWTLGDNAFFLLQVGSGSKRMLYLAPGLFGDKLQQGLTESELALLCLDSGIFKQPSQCEVLERAVSCRQDPYRFLKSAP